MLERAARHSCGDHFPVASQSRGVLRRTALVGTVLPCSPVSAIMTLGILTSRQKLHTTKLHHVRGHHFLVSSLLTISVGYFSLLAVTSDDLANNTTHCSAVKILARIQK